MAENLSWEHLSDFDASAKGTHTVNEGHIADGRSSGFIAPVRYPPYVAVVTILGFAVTIAGFVLSLVFVTVWPVMLLIGGLVVLGLAALSARRAEKISRRFNIDVWNLYQWDSTRSRNLPPQVGHTSPTA